MEFTKFITVYVLTAIIRVKLVLSVPAFGSEFVHIKVFIPNESSTSKQIINSKHPAIHHAPKHYVRHKIINHYRPLRRPIKKQTAPVLEKYLPAELDIPHTHDYLYQHENGQKNIKETFMVKEQLYNSKPKEDEYDHRHQHPVQEYGRNVVDTKKLLDELLDEKPQYNYQQEKHEEYGYPIPKQEVIKVIEAPRYTTTSGQDYYSYRHEPQVKEVMDEEENDYENHQQDKNYKYESHYQIQYGYQQPKKSQAQHYIYQKAPQTKYHYYNQEPNVSIEDQYKDSEGSHNYSQQGQQNFKHTSTVFEPYTTNYNINEENSNNNNEPKKVTNENYFHSSEVPVNLNESHSFTQKHNYVENNSNTINDLSNAVVNPHAIETYTGYDSYTAAHVQGLGSGGYRHHMSK